MATDTFLVSDTHSPQGSCVYQDNHKITIFPVVISSKKTPIFH